MLHTLPRPGSRLQTMPGTGCTLLPDGYPEPDPAVFAAAVTRYRALEKLREFRSRLYACLARRADALFELTDAVLCADHAVASLVRLCLEPEFTRGHGALYDALSAGRVDDERLFSLLAAELPPAVDGPEASAWIAEHDLIDRETLEKALAGLAPGDAAQVLDACARWSRLRFAVDATAYPRPDAWCSPGREHVHHGACHCKGSSKTAPGWEYQFTAAVGHLRTAWAALIDVARTTPTTRTTQTIAQVRNVLRRLRAAGHGRKAAPLFVFDAGYSAAALADGLLGCPAHILVRLATGSVFYAEPVTWDGKYGRPPRRGAAVHCLELADFAAAEAGPGAGRSPCPRTPSPTRNSPCPIPALRHRPRRGLAPRPPPHPRRPRLVRRTKGTTGPARHPRPRHRRAPARRTRPAPRHVAVACRPRPPVPGRALARLPRTLRHRARLQAPQGHPRPHRRESPRPRSGRPLDPAPHGRACPAPARPPPGRRPPPALGETPRSRPAADPRPGPPGISQHPPPPRDTRPCRETLPARTRQTQRQQQRPSTPVPAPRRSRHAAYSKHDADQEKG